MTTPSTDTELDRKIDELVAEIRSATPYKYLPKKYLTQSAIPKEAYDKAHRELKREAKAQIKQLIETAVAIDRLKRRIETLDVQCSEGTCKNCDGKRPLLNVLNDELAVLQDKGEK